MNVIPHWKLKIHTWLELFDKGSPDVEVGVNPNPLIYPGEKQYKKNKTLVLIPPIDALI